MGQIIFESNSVPDLLSFMFAGIVEDAGRVLSLEERTEAIA